MIVTQYGTIFVDLSCHELILISTERERVTRFIDGLTFSIRLQMDKETRMIFFLAGCRGCYMVERIRGQGREEVFEK